MSSVFNVKALVASSISHATRGTYQRTYKTRIAGLMRDELVPASFQTFREVEYGGVKLEFLDVNPTTRYRTATFATKEPETLEWIDSFRPSTTFWDIGANVGLYSCYAAARASCNVTAFEPSIFNLEALARNVFRNGLQNRVTLVPLAVSDEAKVEAMKLTSVEWGGALSSFGADYGYDGRPLDATFEYRTVGTSLDRYAQQTAETLPNYLKIDVDGTEQVVLEGACQTLPHIDEIMIEINDEFSQQRERSERLLKNAGFELVAKRNSSEVAGGLFESTFNQLWRNVRISY